VIDEDNFPAQDQVAEADVSGVRVLEDPEKEATTTENVPDVAIDEDKVSVILPVEYPTVTVSVPQVSLADQLANVHPVVSEKTVTLLGDDRGGWSGASQNTGYVKLLHELLVIKAWAFAMTCCSVPSPKNKESPSGRFDQATL
jgi:hypothetical protein